VSADARDAADPGIRRVDDMPALLGESPVWLPDEQCLFYCDIPGRTLHRVDPASGERKKWGFDCDLGSCAPTSDGAILIAMRDGLWRFDPRTGHCQQLAEPPYEPAKERFNDGKCDPQGRFWVGTIYEPREPALAALYRYADGRIDRLCDGITVSNGLGWSPDGATMYWTDTTAHTVFAFDFDGTSGALDNPRVFASFERKQPGQDLATYGGRPDGAAVDAEGCYWAAMFEGQRLVRLSPQGELIREVKLPVRCPTMPCFGGPDLKTIYITTARLNRPDDELRQQPWAGCLLAFDVDVPGLPANVFKE
jgi:sugar lactone lactonase YvrE